MLKNNGIFTLRETGPAKTGAAGLFLPALLTHMYTHAHTHTHTHVHVLEVFFHIWMRRKASGEYCIVQMLGGGKPWQIW